MNSCRHPVADKWPGEDAGGGFDVVAQYVAEPTGDGAHGPPVPVPLFDAAYPMQETSVGQKPSGAGRTLGQYPVLGRR